MNRARHRWDVAGSAAALLRVCYYGNRSRVLSMERMLAEEVRAEGKS